MNVPCLWAQLRAYRSVVLVDVRLLTVIARCLRGNLRTRQVKFTFVRFSRPLPGIWMLRKNSLEALRVPTLIPLRCPFPLKFGALVLIRNRSAFPVLVPGLAPVIITIRLVRQLPATKAPELPTIHLLLLSIVAAPIFRRLDFVFGLATVTVAITLFEISPGRHPRPKVLSLQRRTHGVMTLERREKLTLAKFSWFILLTIIASQRKLVFRLLHLLGRRE